MNSNFMVDFIHTVAGYSERVFGAIFAVGSISLLIFSAFKSETGIGFIKKFGIFAVLIGALTTLSLVFNVTSIFSPLVDFFTFIKSSLYLFDFVVDIPYFFLNGWCSSQTYYCLLVFLIGKLYCSIFQRLIYLT